MSPDKFNPALLEKAFLHHRRFVELDDHTAGAILNELIKDEVGIYREGIKVIGRHLGDSSPDFPWSRLALQQIDHPTFRKQHLGDKAGVGVFALSLYNLYIFWQHAEHRVTNYGCNEFAIDARLDCPIHTPDLWKVVPKSYLQKKPMREQLYCKCWADWAPKSERIYKRWMESIQRYRHEAGVE